MRRFLLAVIRLRLFMSGMILCDAMARLNAQLLAIMVLKLPGIVAVPTETTLRPVDLGMAIAAVDEITGQTVLAGTHVAVVASVTISASVALLVSMRSLNANTATAGMAPHHPQLVGNRSVARDATMRQ